MPNHSPIDAAFAALADPTRRAVVERLGRGPASVSTLAADHPIALPSFMQHLRQLESAGLIRSEKQGRVRTCTLSPQALTAVETWIIQRRRDWEARLGRLGAYLDQLEDPNV
ncbi:metalloregulator ArsR/SmtB family transcription factor [Sphingomonas sp. LB-2]|uniref:ArsR/SmtB family transcription factor n=1 Tax=Sphingomonas caeni TaxID=2984949 RepID=UPI0022302F2B|nr:metalloregulator ArsR/SmtB family transcription factor [Sphingomonas caeni]MCW3847668.1 metalloregulator ArsR/SmtB family transcription factor [Sphingomonas caeni]